MGVYPRGVVGLLHYNLQSLIRGQISEPKIFRWPKNIQIQTGNRRWHKQLGWDSWNDETVWRNRWTERFGDTFGDIWQFSRGKTTAVVFWIDMLFLSCQDPQLWNYLVTFVLQHTHLLVPLLDREMSHLGYIPNMATRLARFHHALDTDSSDGVGHFWVYFMFISSI